MFSLNRLQVIWTSQPFLNESVVTELRMHKCSPSPSRTYSLAVSFWIHSLEQICSCHCLKHLDSLILFENTHWLYIHYVLLRTQEENRENAAICKGISPLLFHKDVFFSHTLKSYIRIWSVIYKSPYSFICTCMTSLTGFFYFIGFLCIVFHNCVYCMFWGVLISVSGASSEGILNIWHKET